MTRPSVVLSILAAVLLSLGATVAAPAMGDEGGDVIEFEVVVCVGPGHTIDEVVTALDPLMLSIHVEEQIGPNTFLVEFEYLVGTDPALLWAVVIDLFQNGVIVWGDNNYYAQAPEGRTDSLWFTGIPIGADAFEGQYARDVLGVPFAVPYSSGEGVVVAVIDTGLDLTHPVVADSVLPGWDFISASDEVTDPSDGLDNDGDGYFDEMAGHGTFVASCVRLVARDASIMPLRVLDSDGMGNQFRVAAAIDWAVAHGADIINLSLGSNGQSQVVADAVLAARQAGVAVICAIGNDATNVMTQYPASDPNAYAVAATDSIDNLATFSNYGPDVFVCAPGVSTQSGGQFLLTHSIIGAIPGGDFAIWSGTSFSTAFASGLAAVVLSQHPEWPDQGTPVDQIPDAVMGIVAAHAANIDLLNPGFEGFLGAGRIDAMAAASSGPIAPFQTDLSGDGIVDGADLTLFLSDWGGCGVGACLPDINRDSLVDGADLAALFADWS